MPNLIESGTLGFTYLENNNKTMSNLEVLLQWLDGKKAMILAISGLVVGYSVAANFLDARLGTLILSILNILSGGAVVATNQVLGARDRDGIRRKI